MAKKNYNKMYKPETERVEETTPVAAESVKEEVVAEPVKEEVVEKVEAPVERVKAEVVVEATVVGCTLLNVRAEANADAEVVCRIKEDDVVHVTKKESTKDFYKVCTAAGIEGFCMKQFIKLK